MEHPPLFAAVNLRERLNLACRLFGEAAGQLDADRHLALALFDTAAELLDGLDELADQLVAYTYEARRAQADADPLPTAGIFADLHLLPSAFPPPDQQLGRHEHTGEQFDPVAVNYLAKRGAAGDEVARLVVEAIEER